MMHRANENASRAFRFVLLLMVAGPLAQANDYVGDQACQTCHAAEARAFQKTGMGRSMTAPSLTDPLGEFRRAAKVAGPAGISYVSTVRDGRVYHESVRGDAVLESHEVLYSMGSGEHGRSYLIARGDALFMSPLSYYTTKGAWDLSPGYGAGAFRDFIRPVVASCVFCHAGLPQPVAGTVNRYQQPPFRALAIGCERCHGPGELHVQQRSAGTIVNPAKLSPELRDDVCHQCHLGGDIRVLRPGKTELDFRPGTYLDDVVAVFSVPASAKPEGLDAVGQVGQLRMSRCWRESQGRLGCITCHDPHIERTGPEAAAFYRAKCQECHATRPCTAPVARRRTTTPADNCVACHMPQNPLNRVAHIAHTNHRILRNADEALDPSAASAMGFDLIYEIRRSQQKDADLRSKALAYAEAARGLPMFADRALQLLEQASKTYPDDAGVAGAFGLVLRNAGGTRRQQAAQFLERAVSLGSKSVEVRSALADLLAASGDAEQAVRLGREAIQLTPFDAAPYIGLARIYLQLGDRTNAAALLNQARGFDPANPALPELLRQTGDVR